MAPLRDSRGAAEPSASPVLYARIGAAHGRRTPGPDPVNARHFNWEKLPLHLSISIQRIIEFPLFSSGLRTHRPTDRVTDALIQAQSVTETAAAADRRSLLRFVRGILQPRGHCV